MKVIIVICLVILSHEKISANYLRLDNSGKSSLSTEYQARFQQRHCDGVNVSEGNIEGNHKFEKSTNEEPWESFASKCASIIHGLVAALTSAVAPAPGDAMNLELDIKNHIFHHDDRQYNTCKPAGALPDCGNVPSTALAPPGIPVGGQTLTYPPDGGFVPPMNNYRGTDAVTLGPGIGYGDDMLQLPQSQPLGGSVGYLPVQASPTPEPTMNTPATHEASCETTTPYFSSVTDFRNPSYAVPNTGGLPDFNARNKLIDGSQSYPADVLPLDNWKPCPNHQTDLISPGTTLTDDCSSTSPHLNTGIVTPASLPPKTLCSKTLAWEKFYNEHPELLSSNTPPKSRSCSPTDNPPWSSGFEWETPSQELDYLPPSPINADPFNPLTGDSLGTPVPPVTDCPPSDVVHGGQQSYLPPVGDNNSFPEILPGNNFGTPNASGDDYLPGDTYTNQQPGFAPPFDGMNDISNTMPGDNFGLPPGSGNDFPLDGTFSNKQPGYLPEIGGAGAMPGDFGEPVAPGTDCPSEDNYPDQQQGYLPPDNAYGDGVLPGQYLGNTAGAPAGAPLENAFPQQQEYPPPIPPPSFSSSSPGIIPSDSLVTQNVPIPDFSPDNSSQNQQPGLPPPLSPDGSVSNSLLGQNTEGPLIDNLSPFPSQQPGQFPPQPFIDEPSNVIPGQNLDGPLESGPIAGNNWDPNQQLGQLPPQPSNDGLPNYLPGQGLAEPVQSDPLAGNNNWSPFPNQQLGQLPPQPFNGDSSNAIPGQSLGGPMESAPLGTDNWSPYPNQLPGGLPQPVNGGSPYPVPGQNFDGPLESGAPAGNNRDPNQQLGQLPSQPFNDGFSNKLPGQGPADPMQLAPVGSDNLGPYPNQELGQLPQPFNDDSPNAIPGPNLGGPMESGPLGTDNWGPYPDQLPGGRPLPPVPQPVDGGSPYPVPGQILDGPLESGAPAGNNWVPNQQLEQLPSQPFNDDSPNAIPGQSLGGPLGSGPLGTDNWGPYPNQLPGGLPQPVNGGSPYPVPGQNLDGPLESGAPAGNNWDPNQQLGQLPSQPFNGDSSNAAPGQNLGGPMESGPLGTDNWGPNPNQQVGQLPPQPSNDGLSNNLPGQGPSEPVQSGPLESNNWGPFPNQQPVQFPPQPFNGDSSNAIPGPNLGGLSESAPLGTDNWSPYPNQQPGGLPPRPFNGDSSNAIPEQIPGGPVESGPTGSDNWGPYPDQQPGNFPYPPFTGGPTNHLPGNDFPEPPSSEPDNSLEGNNWGGSPQNQPHNLYGMNGPTNFIPGNNIQTPVSSAMPDPGMNSGNGQQPPLPPGSGGFNDVAADPTPSDQTIPDDIAATEPTFNGPNTPEYSDNGYGPGPAGSNSGYNPFWNKEPSGANFPAGNAHVGAEQPMIPPGMFEPPALESANQISEPRPNQLEQAGAPGFSAQDPEGGDYIPESTVPVPDYITPAYDDVISDYNPEMEYQGPEDYGPGMNAAPNGALPKPIQVPPQYQNGFPQGKPNFYDAPNQGWSPNGLYNQRPGYGPTSAGVDPSAIYIPVDPQQSIMLTDPNQDQDSDELCSCDDCYYDDIVDQKAFRKTACRDLEEARDELKAIFDKIKKKLRCTQKKKCFTNV